MNGIWREKHILSIRGTYLCLFENSEYVSNRNEINVNKIIIIDFYFL